MTKRAGPENTGRALALALTGIPASVGMMCLSPVLPLIEQSYAADPVAAALVKYILVSIGIGMVLGAPLAGILSDRLGRREVLMVSLLAFCLCGAAGFLVGNIYVLIALRVLVGAAASSVLAVGVALIGDLCADSQRDRIIGINATCSSVAAILTVPLAGYLGDIGPKLPFLLHLVPLPILLLVALFVPRVGGGQRSAEEVPVKLESPHWLITSYALAAGVAIFAIPVFLPFFMRDSGIASAFDNSLVLTVQSVSAASFAIAYGWARQRLSIGTTFAVSFSLFVVGCLVLLSFTELWGFYLAAGILGMGMAWVAPNLMSSASVLSVPQNRGKVVGLVKGVNLSGSFFAVLLLDPMYRSQGTAAVVATLCLLGAGLVTIGLLSLRKLGVRA